MNALELTVAVSMLANAISCNLTVEEMAFYPNGDRVIDG